MAYKISGTLNESARILVLKESDWSIESNVEKSAGDYEVDNLVSGTKTVVAIDGAGEVVGYGSVSPEYYGGDRGIIGGGYNGSSVINTLEYITISTIGNAADFGDLVLERYEMDATSNASGDKGVFGSGRDINLASLNSLDYITISVAGNATSFGELTTKKYKLAATSNATNNRGIFGGGYDDSNCLNVIDYITISSPGNATDFGDLTVARRTTGATSNGINNRGVFASGKTGSGDYVNTIDYITISSLGNAIDFGDLIAKRIVAATSNSIHDRGVSGGGYDGSNPLNVMEYITISSLGNATDFGDLTMPRTSLTATSNGTDDRGVFCGGHYISSYYNTIDYITISTIGNASDFGDLTVSKTSVAATSDA